jgi:hypothetical protein
MFLFSASVVLGLGLIADELVHQLGAASFTERECAQRAIESLGEFALPNLLRGRGWHDLEIQRRCERALCKLNSFGLTRMPRIDSLPQSTDEVEFMRRKAVIASYVARARLEPSGNSAVSEDEVYRRATVLYCEWWNKRAKCSRSEIRKFLLEMEKHEQKQQVDHR